jgi:hypothetical protein
MTKHRRRSGFLALATLLAAAHWGCSDDKDDNDACESAAARPSRSLDDPNPVFTGSDLTLTGTLTAGVRLQRFEIAELAVTGTDNYSTWKVTVPARLIEEHRTGKTSTLQANVVDVCGTSHPLDPIEVAAEALSGIEAEGLSVSLKPPGGDCYLPADGKRVADIDVIASAGAEAIRVSLSATGGTLLGTRDSDHTVLLQASGQGAAAQAFLRATEDDRRVSVAANTGARFSYSESFPVAPAPAFAAAATAENDKPFFASVNTAGRFASCSASSPSDTVSATVAFDGEEPRDALNVSSVEANGMTCGQSAFFALSFRLGTPVGMLVRLRCADTMGQSGDLVITSTGDPETP